MNDQWFRNYGNSTIYLEKKTFRLSYDPALVPNPVEACLGIKTKPETAIIFYLNKTTTYLVLEGDHRDALENFDSLLDCIRYYLDNPSYQSRWSTEI